MSSQYSSSPCNTSQRMMTSRESPGMLFQRTVAAVHTSQMLSHGNAPLFGQNVRLSLLAVPTVKGAGVEVRTLVASLVFVFSIHSEVEAVTATLVSLVSLDWPLASLSRYRCICLSTDGFPGVSVSFFAGHIPGGS